MPAAAALRLSKAYHGAITEIEASFGGYASFWLYCAQCLIETGPKSDTIPYPLWESGMWQEWLASIGESCEPSGMQSGVLSEMLR